ncbi:MAG: hypothetical protein KAT14_01740 [Candidatus Marinimicrobia bacterium]|nr:hypothetical protein [Candidatus Neomarinimicrobiota bacterium]
MNQIKALFKSEYLKQKSTYWLPVWIIVGITVLLLLVALVAAIVRPENIQIMGLDSQPEYLRIGIYGLMFSFSTIFAMFLALMAQGSLNKEKQLGSELFFRCQPVSVWYVTGTKYIMHVYANSILLVGLGIIFAIVISFVSLFFGMGFYLGEALFGVLLGWITYLKAAMVFGSLLFLFSAIFKSNAFMKGAATLGILEGVFAIIESIFRHQINLPNVFATLASIMGPINLENIEEINVALVLGDYRVLFGLLFAIACYATATFIYSYRAKEA